MNSWWFSNDLRGALGALYMFSLKGESLPFLGLQALVVQVQMGKRGRTHGLREILSFLFSMSLQHA